MTSSRRTAYQAGALLLAGAVAGGILAATIGASASTPSAPFAGGGTYTAGPGGPRADWQSPDGHGMRPFAPMTAGTVTDVGSSSVTIKSAAGTKTYAVDAHSDIDKNGEAQLSDLKAGDAVRFVVRPGSSTIAVLHAGDEAKDMPAFGGRHHHGPCPGMGQGGPAGPGENRPAPQPSASTSSNT